MLILQNVGYTHADKEVLFENIHLTLNKQDKVALIGNNGSGKTCLLKIIAGILSPATGHITTTTKPFYIPQTFEQFNDLSIAQALSIDDKIKAMHEIMAGTVTTINMTILNDDWTIEERCQQALKYWQLNNIDLTQKMHTLSGGQKTKVFLAGILIHQPAIILLDEPTNHLDTVGRQLLYNFIQSTSASLIIVSHDRKLLNLLNRFYALNKGNISMYSGNYDFYTTQKATEQGALNHDIKSKEKALRKARELEKETAERKQKLDARGKKKQEKAGLPTISMNTFKNNAERSTSRIKAVHTEKTGAIAKELNELRLSLPDADKIKFCFDKASLHKGKILFTATAINYSYNHALLWKEPLSYVIKSGERIALKGANGSGKTSLLKIITGGLEPCTGSVYRAAIRFLYIDQEYSFIDNQLTVYKQAQKFNTSALSEHEIKIRLSRFLFAKQYWGQPCASLSGGEKMRLLLCCLTISEHAPDVVLLDEPTNNLDIQNIEILTAAINAYEGTIIAVSHDEWFLSQIRISATIEL